MSNTKIEWAQKVWNPITGCAKVSEGCRHCYAERMSHRFGWPWKPTFHAERLEQPLHWRKPSRVFVCSMSDLFHEDIEFGIIGKIFDVMATCTRHTFMIPTKRPDRMLRFAKFEKLSTGEGYINEGNVWLGVSVENQQTADERIPILLQIPAAKRFVSYEPALGPVDWTPYLRIAWQCYGCKKYFPDPWKNICPKCGKEGYWCGSHKFNPPNGQRGSGIGWLICGGESGPNARPMHPDWARSARDQCQAAGVPFFFKQHGEFVEIDDAIHRLGYNPYASDSKKTWISRHSMPLVRVGKKAAGRLLDGREWNEFPEARS